VTLTEWLHQRAHEAAARRVREARARGIEVLDVHRNGCGFVHDHCRSCVERVVEPSAWEAGQ
jgi:hypothetical protein